MGDARRRALSARMNRAGQLALTRGTLHTYAYVPMYIHARPASEAPGSPGSQQAWRQRIRADARPFCSTVAGSGRPPHCAPAEMHQAERMALVDTNLTGASHGPLPIRPYLPTPRCVSPANPLRLASLGSSRRRGSRDLGAHRRGRGVTLCARVTLYRDSVNKTALGLPFDGAHDTIHAVVIA